MKPASMMFERGEHQGGGGISTQLVAINTNYPSESWLLNPPPPPRKRPSQYLAPEPEDDIVDKQLPNETVLELVTLNPNYR